MLKSTVKSREKIDYLLLGIVSILVLLGILMVFSSSAFLSQKKFGYPFYFLFHHLFFGILPGIILGYFIFKTPLYVLKKMSFWIFLANLFLMILVFLPGIGVKFGGAFRWIDLKFATFQPSELLKLTFLIYLSAWLSEKEKASKREVFFGFLILLSLMALPLIFQPDISTLIIISLSGTLLYFLCQGSLKYLFFLFLMGVFSLWFLIKIAPYRMARIMAFLNPETDPLGIGYQINQALITIGSGGIFGKGLGMSQQKFGFLPQSLTDSIFAIYAEETGFLGSFLIIFLFFLFFWRGFSIAENVPDKFSQLLGAGITFWITVQAFFNIGSLTGLLPVAGTSLPFIGYGGSALISQLIGIGVLLNISKKVS